MANNSQIGDRRRLTPFYVSLMVFAVQIIGVKFPKYSKPPAWSDFLFEDLIDHLPMILFYTGISYVVVWIWPQLVEWFEK